MGGKDGAFSSFQLPLAWGQPRLMMAWRRSDAVQDVQALIPPILLVPTAPGRVCLLWPAVNPAGAQAGLNPRLLEQVLPAWGGCTGEDLLSPLQEQASSASAGNPVRSPGLQVGLIQSHRFESCRSRLGCIFYMLPNHPFLKSQGKLGAKAHD